MSKIKEINGQQICVDVTKLQVDDVELARKSKLEVRTWNTKDECLMKHAVQCKVDGMTLNFPDRLVDLM